MKHNMGTIDKAVRILFAVAVGLLYLVGAINGTAAAVLGALAVIMVITSLLSFCPLYVPIGLSTRKKEADTKAD